MKSEKGGEILYDIPYMWNLKINDTNELTKQAHRLWKQNYCWGEGRVREFGMDMYTLLYLKWITNKDLLYSTWNSVQRYVAACMGGEFWGEWIHVYVWLSPFSGHLKLWQHCLLICYAAAAKSHQSCPTLCDPIDGSPPGSPGILKARTLEWVAISFSNAWKWKVKVKSLNRETPRTGYLQ